MSDTDIKTALTGDDPQAGTRVEDLAEQPAAGPAKRKVEPTLGGQLMALMSSFGLTTVILLCLMVLTFFGTYAQTEIGLVRAQAEYFDSFICRINFRLFGFPEWGIRFPGAFLLLIVLAANLICGGIVRIKWHRRNAGILIGHFGIIFLLVAGAVKFAQSTNGSMVLEEGKPMSTYTSFHEWEIAIGERRDDGSVREQLIPDTDLRKHGVFSAAGMPFKLKVEDYFTHSSIHQARGSTDAKVIDGIYILDAKPSGEAGDSRPGAYVTALIDGELSQRGILRGYEEHPWTVVVDGVPWTISLRRRIMDVPFELRLKKFYRELHPGTSMHRHFSSKVIKIEDGVEQESHIKMNEPLRYGGFMFSQNSWGPQNGRPPPYYSILEVTNNPSDQWPKYACYVIAFGLLLHFLRKLRMHVARQQKLREVL